MFSFELVYFASRARVELRVKILQNSRGWKLLAAPRGNDYNAMIGSNPSLMRFKFLAVFFVGAALTGGAFAALVVEKQSRQVPFVEVFECNGVHSFVFRGPTGTSRKPILVPPEEYWTAREAGLYKFVLRYHSGNVCSRLVTPEVFARYRVGDDFNDCAPVTERTTEDSKTVPVVRHRRHTAQSRKHGHTSRYLAKHHRSRRSTRVAAR
jgi:hypothetical protein